jgi:hypothetical protein
MDSLKWIYCTRVGTYVAKAFIQDKVEFDLLFIKLNIAARVVCQQMRQLTVLCERMDDLD